jgi:isoleucyl-tRNA synthetase
MFDLDKWAMIKLNKLIATVLQAYEDYEFHIVFHSIHKFCVVDMSAFYLDVNKDLLYSEKADSPARRSVQTVLYRIADALTRLLTPILAFTTEEIYKYLPKPSDSPESVQLLDMPKFDPAIADDAIEERYEKFLFYRDKVSAALEEARRAKTIGHSLDASVTLTPDEEAYQVMKPLEDKLAKLFITSKAILNPPEKVDGLQVEVGPAPGRKCLRCWIHSEEVNADGLCPRCAAVLNK